MANMKDWEQKNLLNELNLGMEVVKRLQFQLNSPSSSRETREMLVQEILASYQKLLSMLNSSGSMAAETDNAGGGNGMSESPSSLIGSPMSEDSDRDSKDTEYKDGAKKSIPRWTKQVRVNPGMGLEGSLDDGFSWRKYGQKDILGAKHPRGYYRCTHRNVQGCVATKQVQRSDEDSTIFEITYRGRHTCSHANHIPPTAVQSSENQEPKTKYQQTLQENWQPSQELLSNFRRDLKVTTEDLDSRNDLTFPPPFQFPSTSNVNPENHVLSSPLVDNSFMENFPPPYTPSSGTATPYYSPSPSGVHHNFVGNQNFQIHPFGHDVPDHHLIIAAATSASNSPTIGVNFPYGSAEFDPNFTFGGPGFLP